MSWKLNYCYNFSFTERPIRDLASRGFSVMQAQTDDENGLKKGCVHFTQSSLQIFDIIDEDAFQKHEKEVGHRYHSPRDMLRPGIVLSNDQGQNLPIDLLTDISLCTDVRQTYQVPVHANTCYFMRGAYLHVSDSEFANLAKHLNCPLQNNEIVLTDGFRFIQAKENDELFSTYQKRKDFSFWALILQCSDLPTFIDKAEPELVLQWRGQKAALIEEYLTCWDLIVIEEKK